MTDPERYTPLSERLNQDVIHDNFVPKYSALATARPSMLVIVGVWMIFGPMAIGSLFMLLGLWPAAMDLPTTVLWALMALCVGGAAIAILWTQTRRYFNRDRD